MRSRCPVGLTALFVIGLLAVPASTKLTTTVSSAANSRTILKAGDPVSTATGEYYFFELLHELGGLFPLSFDFYYGSQVDSKRLHDGLPSRFSHNLRGTVTRDTYEQPHKISIEPGLEREVVFAHGRGGWEAAPFSRWRHQLKETDNYFFFLDAESELVYTFKKPETAWIYSTVELSSVSSGGTKAKKWSTALALSADGRYVDFVSTATSGHFRWQKRGMH